MITRAIQDRLQRRYTIKVRTEPFRYAGVDGFKLDETAAHPEKWVPRLLRAGGLETAYMAP
jgi:hypothetical protein